MENDYLTPETKNKKTKIIILCSAVAVLIIATVVILILVLGKKESSETPIEIFPKEVVETSGYSEFLERVESENETKLFSELEAKILEDTECCYNCQTDSELESGSKKFVSLFYQDSFFENFDYNTTSLVNETLISFFSSVYPEYKSLAYVGSVLNENEFFVLSDVGDVYRVNITSSGKGISIKNRAGSEVLNYSGRFSTSETEEVVINESDFIKEEDLDKELGEELED